MREDHYGNAMTEVALALAMAFFSIMVLAIVSMGAVHHKNQRTVSQELDKSILVKLSQNKTRKPASKNPPITDDTLVIYHEGIFYDNDLAPINPLSINSSGRIILAISPDTEMAETLSARMRFDSQNLVISMLNQEWLTALNRKNVKEK
ncbi:MAG: hypothetical protein CMF71_09615 [Magnetovibrio sp.]|nr:hypothetical protein [Magnetovibrio sp.]|tara:strand:+ start:651 stop:1097 length:447 start_codon:yes stop_codon:yes gene_type:complete